MRKGLKIFGGILILGGILFILNSQITNITGNIINENRNLASSLLGLFFILGGLIIFASKKEGKLEKTLAQIILKSGKIEPKTKFLIKVAKKSGYTIGKPVKEGTPIYDYQNKRITVIPSHKTVSVGVYRSIIKALAYGKSNFRQNYF